MTGRVRKTVLTAIILVVGLGTASAVPMAGVYTINAPSGGVRDFTSFRLAANAVNTNGISDSVVFDAYAKVGDYNEACTLKTYTNTGSKWVKFRAAAGQSNPVRIYYTPGFNSGTFVAIGPSYKLENLTIEVTGTAQGTPVWGSTNVTGLAVRNCRLLNNGTGAGGGIKFYSGATNDSVIGDSIVTYGGNSIDVYGGSPVYIANNYINNTNAGRPIYTNAANPIIVNNMVTVSGAAGGGAIAIWAAPNYAKIYYNTVLMTGNATTALWISSASAACSSYNNIYKNNYSFTGAYAVYVQNVGTLVEDYDCLYAPGGNVAYLGSAYTFAAWQATGREAHGINADPGLVSTTDLHLSAGTSPCVGKGLVVTGITKDRDADRRKTGIAPAGPDMGADEFKAPPVITVIDPAAGVTWFIGSTQNINWTNSGGDATLDSIWYSTTGTAPWTLINSDTGLLSDPWVIPSTPTTNAAVQVKASNTAGAKTGTGTSGTFTIAFPTPPGPFSLSTPPNGAVNVPIAGSLTWTASAQADSYIVYLDVVNPPVAVVSRQTSAAANYAYSGLTNLTRYYWDVVAKNAAGTTPANAPHPDSFTTIIAAPGAFNLSAPPNGAVNVPIAGNVTWTASVRADSYIVYLDVVNPPVAVVSRQTSAAVTYAYTGLTNLTKYYWDVQAKNIGGTTMPNAPHPDSFTTIVAAPGAFDLSTPVNGAVNVPIAGNVTWTASARADSYIVYLDVVNPPVAVASRQTSASTSYAYSALSNLTKYYWDVQAKNIGGTTMPNAPHPDSFTTVVVAPGAFTLTSPANNAIDQPIAGTLIWSTSALADSYIVYLDQSNPPTTVVSRQVGTSYAYSGLGDNANYYWDIVAKNAGGTTSPTVHPFHFTTIVGAPGAFNLSTPANNAVNVPVAGNVTWTASALADSYIVYLDQNNPPTTVVSRQLSSSTSYAYSGLSNNANYYWRVDAKNIGGTTTATGSPFHFTTIIAAPGAFTLISPANNAVNQPISGILNWSTSALADSYIVYLDQNNPPTTVVSRQLSSSTSYAYSGLTNNAVYHWKVEAKNISGITTATGSPYAFTTITAAPGAFTLTSPANNATNQPISGTLTWTASALADSYIVMMDQNNPPTTVVSRQTSASTSYAYSGLSNSANYYWDVIAKNAGGTTSPTVHPFHFTTVIAAPGAFTLTSPANNAVNQPISGTLTWSTSALADSYIVYLDQNNPPTTVVSRQVGTSYAYSGLSNSTNYYWDIVAKNVGGTTSPTVHPFNFTTIIGAPGAFTLTSPANNAVNQPVAGTLTWTTSALADSYIVYLDQNNPPTTIVSRQTGISYAYSGLSNSTSYYWDIVAKNAGGTTSPTVHPFHFTTVIAAPGAFTLTSPANNATNQLLSGTLTWAASALADSYIVYLDQNNPPTTVVSRQLSSSTSYAYSGLSNSANYYWDIVAKNVGGTTSPTVHPFHFTTIIAAPGVFTLTAPANNAVNVPISGSLTWTASVGADSYVVYLDQNNPPTTVVSRQAGTSYAYAGLSNSASYYWDIVAKNVGGTTSPTVHPFHFTTIIAAPGAFTLTSPANNAVNQPISGTLTWSTSALADSYVVYLDQNNPPTTVVSRQVGTSYAYSGLSNSTNYYWDIVAKNVGGATSPTVHPFHFTTIIGAPGAFNLSTPANNAINVPISGNLTWTASTSADSYIVLMDQNNPPTTVVSRQTSASTSYAYSGLSNSTNYYWDVQAKNIGGTTSPTTHPFHFTTIIAAPGAFNLSTPANGAINVPTSGNLTWTASTSADSYIVLMDQNNPPTTVVSRQLSSSTSYAYSGLSNSANYYWDVIAKNVGGTTPPTVHPFHFTTIIAAPGAFTLTSPANNAVNQPVAGTLSWTASVGADSYIVLMDQNNPPTTVVSRQTSASTSYAYSGLSNSTSYYWDIVAKNAGGTTSPTVHPFHFTTVIAAPGAFTLTSPANNATNQLLSGTLTWAASALADSYIVYLDQNNPPTTVVSRQLSSSTSYAYSGLSNSANYYWDIVAKNVGGTTSPTVHPFHFTTIIAAPGVFTLTAPANNAVNVPISGSLTWTASAAADSYIVYLDQNNPPTTVVSRQLSSSTSYAYSGLSNGGNYYWDVIAKNVGGTTSPTVHPFHFTTVVGAPIVALLHPNGGENWQAGTMHTIDWTNTGGADVLDSIWYRTLPGAGVLGLGTRSGTAASSEGTQAGGPANPVPDAPWIFVAAITGPATSYDWTVPDNPTTQAAVKVTAYNQGGLDSALSLATFTILPRSPAITVDSPAAGVDWQIGTQHWITWSNSGGAADLDSVWYSATGSAPWTFIIAQTGAQTSYQWLVSGPASASAAVRVLASNTGGTSSATSALFTISTGAPAETSWVQDASVPPGVRGKTVRQGGALSYWEATPPTDTGAGYIFALKGNNRYEFYRYSTVANAWTTMESIPALNPDGKKRAVRKGSVLVTGDDGSVYASKGNNTLWFWRYDPLADQWYDAPALPSGIGTRAVREGAGAVPVRIGTDNYIYFLKGSGTTEFYRWKVGSAAWETMQSAPLYPDNHGFKNGSVLAYDGSNTIYAVKGLYNTLYAYDVVQNSWASKDSVPMRRPGSTRKKKVKDGAGMAYVNGSLYIQKGNGTNEFWQYEVGSSLWHLLADIGGIKPVKAGGALVYAPSLNTLFSLKGNNTLDFWSYRLPAAPGSRPVAGSSSQAGIGSLPTAFSLRAAPNPFTGTGVICYALPVAGNVNLRLFDATGTLVMTLASGHAEAGSHACYLDAHKLARGIYLLKLECEGYRTSQKLILE